jgi:hypothetical protein
MTEPNRETPLAPDPPEPADPERRAPDLTPPGASDDRDIPDDADVTTDAGTVEAPD